MAAVHLNLEGFTDVPSELLTRAVTLVIGAAGIEHGEVSVTLLGDEDIRELNRTYLGLDNPTDVIAFTLSEESEALLGDVYIGYDQAVRQAKDMGIGTDEELARLVIHGTLHVLGHDHPHGEDRSESPMWLLQESLLTRLLDVGI